MRLNIVGLICWCLLAASAVAAEPDKAALAQQVQAILKANCYRCHGQDGVFEGGMNFILDAAKLAARKKIVPGKPDESPLYLRVMKGAMPPVDEQPRPSAADKAILKQWIEVGAPGPSAATAARRHITPADEYRAMLADLETMDRRGRRFVRYFSLAHLYNLGLSDDELQTYRNALSKLVNSLSWHHRIAVPQPVDEEKTLLRVDLRWYMWDAGQWNRLLAEYPYGVLDDSATARAVMVGCATKLPLLRGDWFIANACRPPLYFDLLQLPNSIAELERQLRVDAAVDIQQERVARAGFNGSGVSKNNRILERHDSVHGAYWRTYDFEAVPQNLVERNGVLPDQRNIFAFPLGPAGVASGTPFLQAGGEAIFSLPNGLHGFMLVNAVGTRVDKAAIQIVSDPKRPDRAVETGVSCMSCHLGGINPKADQVRDFVAKNSQAFSRGDAELIRALYPPEAKMKKLMEEDAERYRRAVAAAGAKVTKTEPVSTLTLRYEADVDLPTAAAEAGFSPEEFREKIAGSEILARNLGPLRVDGGTVSRQVFVQSFGDLVRDLKLGTLFAANANGGTLPDNTGDLDPLESQGNQTNHAAFSRDGKLALLAGGDRSVRLFDVIANRDIRRFVGHTASVWCVAFSPDERQALSGSMDGTVRLWDVATGQELKRLDGHLSLVAAVAFSPDGKYGISGGYDGAAVVWQLDPGREVARFEKLAKYIHSVAFTPDGKRALVGGDNLARLIGVFDGLEVRSFPGHTGVVTAIALSANGKWLLTGSDDRTVRLWDVASGKEVHQFRGHAGPIKDVAFAPSGKAILSGAADHTVRLWERGSGKELAVFSKHADSLARVAFIDEGKQTLSVSRDGAVKYWPLKKFEALVTAPVAELPAVPKTEQRVEALKPIAVIPINGTIGNLTLSPNRKWLFLLNRTSSRLTQIDSNSLKVTHELWVKGCETFCLTRDGKTIATFLPDDGRATIALVDPVPLSLRVQFRVDVSPYDIAATDAGLIFLSGESGGWADVAVVDVKKQALIARWGGVWNRSLLQLSAGQDRLYVSSQGVSPGKLEAFPIPTKLEDKPSAINASLNGLPAGGPFTIAPDGQFAIFQTGSAVRLSANASDDMQAGVKLTAHLSAAADAERGLLFLLAADGFTVKQYSYPELQWQKDLRLGALAQQIAFDGHAGRLYASVIDPQALRDRPRARGIGDVHVYESREWITGKR